MSHFDCIEDLIDHGLLNKNGQEDEIIGYTGKPCVNCGRMRVEEYKSGMLVCEKCNWDQIDNEHVQDDYYRN